MYLYKIVYRTIRICLYCLLSLIVLFSLVGFRDSTSKEIKRDGVKCALKARIIEKVINKKGQGLVVIKKYDIEKNKGKTRGVKDEKTEDKTKRIYVLVTAETEIGYTTNGLKKKFIRFDDLKVDMSVVIEGIRVLQKVDDQEIIIVWAKSIEPVE